MGRRIYYSYIFALLFTFSEEWGGAEHTTTLRNEQVRASRDITMEADIFKLSQRTGIGAQFGGKYFCHVRVIRLPRHGASCPVSMCVSWSADRQILGQIRDDGIFLERLEANPAQFLPDIEQPSLSRRCMQVYLASIGGIAGTIAEECFKSIEYPELGMEAMYKVEVEKFPAFIVIDNTGNDFFKQWRLD